MTEINNRVTFYEHNTYPASCYIFEGVYYAKHWSIREISRIDAFLHLVLMVRTISWLNI